MRCGRRRSGCCQKHRTAPCGVVGRSSRSGTGKRRGAKGVRWPPLGNTRVATGGLTRLDRCPGRPWRRVIGTRTDWQYPPAEAALDIRARCICTPLDGLFGGHQGDPARGHPRCRQEGSDGGARRIRDTCRAAKRNELLGESKGPTASVTGASPPPTPNCLLRLSSLAT